jgi:hypothetical protein
LPSCTPKTRRFTPANPAVTAPTSVPASRRRTRRGDTTTTKHTKKSENREKVIIPTPEEWAQQQLKNAPPRSEEWAKRVASIYCLDIVDDTGREAV